MVGTLTVTLPGTFARRRADRPARREARHLPVLGQAAVVRRVLLRLPARGAAGDQRLPDRADLQSAPFRSDATPPSPEPGETAALAACLEEHFAEQSRLVYLLDHQYTARGMSWTHLKGVDAQRVRALDAAALASGCEIALALADVHESWSAARARGTIRAAATGTTMTTKKEKRTTPRTTNSMSCWTPRSA